MKRVGNVVNLLVQAKQPQSDFVKLMDSFKNPYLVLIACILSLRTNDKTTYPATLRMLELAKTPHEMMKVNIEDLEKEYTVYKINAMDEALKLGNSKVFNIIVLGMAAKHMDFSKEDWLKVIEKTVPPKTVEINKKAFLLGFEGGC